MEKVNVDKIGISYQVAYIDKDAGTPQEKIIRLVNVQELDDLYEHVHRDGMSETEKYSELFHASVGGSMEPYSMAWFDTYYDDYKTSDAILKGVECSAEVVMVNFIDID